MRDLDGGNIEVVYWDAELQLRLCNHDGLVKQKANAHKKSRF
jgi:hypothetical protein